MSKNRAVALVVQRTEELTPHMRRVVLGGDDVTLLLEAWQGFSDSYVKLVFLADDFEYPEPLLLDVVRAAMPPEAAPVLRTYTLRHVDPEAHEVWIDFVLHGDEGVAGPWAAAAAPGDVLHVRLPGGAYRPDPSADHHLLVGDEAALPAIANALRDLPAGTAATVFLEVDGPQDELPLPSAAEVAVHWLHRAGARPGTTTLLDDAVRAWEWPGGRVAPFVHGESALLKTVRPYLREERAVERADLSVSAYWRQGDTEESFRAWKARQDDAVLRPAGS